MSVERRGRVAEEIKKEVSDILRTQMRDPALQGEMVSIVSCEVTRDMSLARLQVSVYGSPEQQQAAIPAIKKAAGFIRREVGRRIRLRVTPELRFELDTGIEYSIHIAKLLDEVGVTPAEDEEHTDTDGDES